MARFVHLADSRAAGAIRRNGLRDSKGWDIGRGVFCVPVVPDHARTFQWARELRRHSAKTSIAVFFVLVDATPAFISRYGGEKIERTAAEAHDFFRSADDPFGYEVFVPRSIGPGEIRAMGPAPRVTGWRFFPGAKGQRPYWPCPGTRNAARLRRAIEEWHASYET
ncbi:MAG: hypothetical protein WAP03_28890 [Methylorubrum rhodinum]|uniref:hypothetical protein n=1 Tax=Methylorubrum rhodinum TaxID=29428 RepID=UPI003BAF6E47